MLAALATVALWQLPGYGSLVLYPFSILATYAHEMGHGLTAIAVGGRFEYLVIHPDGSGLASWRGDVGRIGRAMVAAGGLVGPSVLGATVLALSARPGRARLLLVALGAGMLLSALLLVRSGFGLVFVTSVGVGLVAAARFLPAAAATFFIQLLGVQLCVALFHDVGYMFSESATVGGQVRLSDSGAMAEALLLPYWFWGGCVAVFSAAVLVLGLRVALRPSSRSRA